jgi:kynureninase
VATVTSLTWTRERCEDLDVADPLGQVRDRFLLEPGEIYLNGNSLGALARNVPARIAEVVEREWGASLNRGWAEGDWLSAPERVGDKIGAVIGARPGEVIACDTTTIVLAKLLGSALYARQDRKVILTTATNFPTDIYAARGVARQFGDVDVRAVDPGALAGGLDESVAVLCLTHVDYRTGEMLDIAALSAAARRAGALSLWDLSHSAGAVVVDCEANGVDLAVGCGYKYLNGGPGAPAFLYVRDEHQSTAVNPLPGWLGHEDPFGFSVDYRPAGGIRRFLTSTPPILALSALEAALDCRADVSSEQVRAKSVQLTELFVEALEERLPGRFDLASPRDPERRGSQVSLRHPDAQAIVAALAERGVIGDFRPPDVCRLGFAALYLRYVDAFAAAEHLVAVMDTAAPAPAPPAARRTRQRPAIRRSVTLDEGGSG